ncbi:MAG TPA: dihydrodipicolinate synthase family protein [Anaerolineae bacterium]|nr:dihydrodipicolinate synthase family protein [Anaerolineae bacterium]
MMKEQIAALKERLENGVSPAMATPLLADGYTVDTAVIPQLVNFLLDKGAAGLFVGGTTGEGILLAPAERMRLHEAVALVVDGRVPVIVHTGANQVNTAVTLARHAAKIGADAIAAVTPWFYGMPDEALAAYYQTIAQAAPQTPLLLYDIPHMAGNGISPALLARLADELPTFAGMKCSRPDAQMIRKLLDTMPDEGIFLAGNEAIALGSLAMGADGLITGLSTAVPEPFVALTAAFAAGNLAEAQRWQRIINQMLACLPTGRRIGAIKQILAERGIAVGTAVPPRPMPAAPVWPEIQNVIE